VFQHTTHQGEVQRSGSRSWLFAEALLCKRDRNYSGASPHRFFGEGGFARVYQVKPLLADLVNIVVDLAKAPRPLKQAAMMYRQLSSVAVTTNPLELATATIYSGLSSSPTASRKYAVSSVITDLNCIGPLFEKSGRHRSRFQRGINLHTRWLRNLVSRLRGE
jgi:hypothetical protein